MRIWSDSFEHRHRIPAEFAMGTPEGFGGNRNPHLAWADAPAETRSFVLMCIDTDVPTDASTVGRDDLEIPVEQPRAEFAHWVMVDIPASVHEIGAGTASEGVTTRGKQDPKGPPGARQGLNSYTDWFANDADMKGQWRGYDGPYPPFNDLRLHRYFFRLFAVRTEKLDVPADFTVADVFHALQPVEITEAAVYGTYSLNPKVTG